MAVEGGVPTIGAMSIPTRSEAARILRDLEPPDWLLEHSAVVADVASFLAQRIDDRGHAIDVGLVEAAGLLHDLDKALPANDPVKGFGHGDAGAAWLRERGHDELAGAVASHPVTRLREDERYEVWVQDATVEERVVAYADKRSRQDLVTLDDRFRRWIDKHGDNPEMRVARGRAEKLEEEVCAAAGLSPEQVQRERWAEAELGQAR
jgi:putative nucleotidyltransferase with HDIG domain